MGDRKEKVFLSLSRFDENEQMRNEDLCIPCTRHGAPPNATPRSGVASRVRRGSISVSGSRIFDFQNTYGTDDVWRREQSLGLSSAGAGDALVPQTHAHARRPCALDFKVVLPVTVGRRLGLSSRGLDVRLPSQGSEDMRFVAMYAHTARSAPSVLAFHST